MNIHQTDTAVVFIDPQNEVLSEKGAPWPLLKESLTENNTIENMERIFRAAKAHGFEVFISPHYFYPTDNGWMFNGPLETEEIKSRLFARKGVLNLDGLEGSGADWLERFKPYIEDGKTIVVAPHRVFGSSKVSKWPSQKMRRLRQSTPNGATAIRRRSLTSPFSPTRSGQPMKPSRRWSRVNRNVRCQESSPLSSCQSFPATTLRDAVLSHPTMVEKFNALFATL
jgi:hypothetical protein